MRARPLLGARAVRAVWSLSIAATVLASCSLSSLDELQSGVAEARGDGGAVLTVDAAGDAKICVSGACADADADAEPDSDACSAKTCAELGAQCGVVSDGCGNLLDCGACAASHSCGANNQCSCVPETCASLGAECGSEPDGCGATLDCGSCGANEQCDDGQCECVPKTCASIDWECGGGSDGCGGQLDCGACGGNTTCDNHACVLAAGNVCGYCPSGFDAFSIYNNECGSSCGQQSVCIRDGISDVSGCGASCPSSMHIAVLTTHCGCPGGLFVVCVPD